MRGGELRAAEELYGGTGLSGEAGRFIVNSGEEQLIRDLRTNVKAGVISSSLKDREAAFGHNRKAASKLKSILTLFIESLDDFTLKILIVAAAVSIGKMLNSVVQTITEVDHRSTAWIEGFAIFIAVLISSLLTTVNNYQKQKQFALLNSISDSRKMVNLIRDGVQLFVHQSEILVGDLIQVDNGMEIPADGILVLSHDISCDESAMTGNNNHKPQYFHL